MGWLKALLGLLGPLVQWFQQRQLIDAGKETERAKNFEETAEIAKRQARAANDSAHDPDDLAKRLRDGKDSF